MTGDTTMHAGPGLILHFRAYGVLALYFRLQPMTHQGKAG